MLNLTDSQYKALSEFLNTIAAAWFTAGVISPFFLKPESLNSAIILSVLAIIFALVFLGMLKIPTILPL